MPFGFRSQVIDKAEASSRPPGGLRAAAKGRGLDLPFSAPSFGAAGAVRIGQVLTDSA